MVDKPKAGETKEKYLEYCIPAEIKEGYEAAQATAICISVFERDKMKGIKDTSEKVMASVAYNTKFRGINLLAKDDDPCWSGYEMIGMKDDGTPNCVPIKD